MVRLMCVCDADKWKYGEPIDVKHDIDLYTTDGCNLAANQCTFVSSEIKGVVQLNGSLNTESLCV